MKKIYTLLAMAMITMMTMTSCDADLEDRMEARTLEGTWTGYIDNYYYDRWGLSGTTTTATIPMLSSTTTCLTTTTSVVRWMMDTATHVPTLVLATIRCSTGATGHAASLAESVTSITQQEQAASLRNSNLSLYKQKKRAATLFFVCYIPKPPS